MNSNPSASLQICKPLNERNAQNPEKRDEREIVSTDRPISREKLMDYLKSMYTNPTTVDNDQRYLYVIGRNAVLDILVASVYCGDFDAVLPGELQSELRHD
jgi:hypothetical protein